MYKAADHHDQPTGASLLNNMFFLHSAQIPHVKFNWRDKNKYQLSVKTVVVVARNTFITSIYVRIFMLWLYVHVAHVAVAIAASRRKAGPPSHKVRLNELLCPITLQGLCKLVVCGLCAVYSCFYSHQYV